MRLIVIVLMACVLLEVSAKNYYVNKIAKLNWFAAFQDCQSRGQQLATITSSQEQKEVEHVISQENIKNTAFWISGTDYAEEGNFVWMSTGKPVSYSNWRVHEPNNVNNSEHCIHVTVLATSDAHWNDNTCSRNMYYICEQKQELQTIHEIVDHTEERSVAQ